MHRPEFRRFPTELLGILFFLILVFTYAAIFMVDRRSDEALISLQNAFDTTYEGIQELRIASLTNPAAAALQVDGPLQVPAVLQMVDTARMDTAISRFKNLSTIQWLPRQEDPAIRLEQAWQAWLEALAYQPSPEKENLQLLGTIKLADTYLEELRLRTTDAFDLIIFLSGVLFSLGTSGSIAFYARLRQSQLKEEFSAANLKKALESEDEIRRTIAMELHDDIAQDIAAARMLCERMDTTGPNTPGLASRAATTLGDVNQKIRTLCTELRPPALEETGLQEAIRTLCEAETERHSRPLRFIPGGDIPRLKSLIEANLYRIIREAVVNAMKHARDGNIEVRIRVTGTDSNQSSLSIEIQDSGFEQESRTGRQAGTQASTRGFGFGITAMQERAALIGAALSVQLNPAGSMVRIMMPLKQAERKDH
ncbi:MAG: ATP-binding protein [Clostridia bacterium]